MKKILIVTNDSEDIEVEIVKPNSVDDKFRGLGFSEVYLDEGIDLDQNQVDLLKSLLRNKKTYTEIYVYDSLKEIIKMYNAENLNDRSEFYTPEMKEEDEKRVNAIIDEAIEKRKKNGS